MKKPDNWEPRPSDLDWQRKMLTTINDGGEWRVPANGTRYKFDRTTKTMWLEEGPIDYLNWQIKVTTERVGWTVKRRDRADEKMTIGGAALQSKSVFTGTVFNAANLTEKSEESKARAKNQFVDALVEMGISPLRIGSLEIHDGMIYGIFLTEDRKNMGSLGVEGYSKEDLRPLPKPVPYWG